tara:strand:- start:289 stop:756 length:468 start_codon:yes stop_codon:yes gene_type:complete
MSYTKLEHFFKLGNHLFKDRYLDAPHWKSFDLYTDEKESPMLKHFPYIKYWALMLVKYNGLKSIKHAYLSVLAPKQQIPWHVDMQREGYNKAFITSLFTDNSVIEFKDDRKYIYKQGFSYLLQTGVDHRIINMSDKYRFTLCITPEENPYVSMDN